jgi:3',5'-cyclic AMP phosphodiesterase CpdA
MVRRLALPFIFALIAGFSFAHPDRREEALLMHFAVGFHEIENGRWEDATHSVTARVVGSPRVVRRGPTAALRFNGDTDWLVIADSPSAAGKLLPRGAFSVAAWVSLDKTRKYGGVCGLLQDNGGYEKGWMLGYNDETFTFALAAEGSNDGDGNMTYLAARTKIVPGRWYHVVATYDRAVKRIYVNGQFEGESRKQRGDILYPDRGPLTVGAYIDDDEQHLMEGSLFEVKTYARVLSPAEIKAVSDKAANLRSFDPGDDASLNFLVKPYLQFGTETSMVVMCETNRPTRCSVAYASRQPLTRRAESAEFKSISEIPISGLDSHSTYYYRVTCMDESGQEITSELSSFQTAPPAEMPWSFAVIGDTQRNPDITRRCAEGAYALRPNFLLHCGDVVDDGFAKHQWLNDLFGPANVLMSKVPTFPVIGNHEKDSHWYYDYFSLPKPEYFYTFKYGNAQFFMIDSNKPLGPESEQFIWLDAELGKSSATWKFTCHHHPCFTSDNNDYGDADRGKYEGELPWGDRNAQQLVPLYEKHGVDIAFNGHIHVYERTWPILNMTINQARGVRYITSGGGGGKLEDAAAQRAWFSLHFKKAHHFCYAAVHDRTIVFKAYDVDGLLFDSFELTKPGDR